MSEENFGYEPPNLSRYGESAPDYVDPQTRSRPGEIYDQGQGQAQNDVETATIDEMWLMVTKESDEYAYALSQMWGRVSTLLQATRGNLTDHSQALSEKWESPAAKEFLRRVGGGLLSLDQWQAAAAANATTLANVGQAISRAQAEMKVIWDEYKAASAKEASDRGGLGLGDFNPASDEFLGSDSQDEVRQKYTERARPVMRALADSYMDGYVYGLDRAVPYQGPTNAAVRAPGAAPARPGAAPTAPRGAAPAAPARGAPPAAPAGAARPRMVAEVVPGRPGAPRPPAPVRPTLPGRGAPPVAPAPAPTSLTRTGTPPPTPVTSPAANLARGAAPSRPALPGAGPGGRGAAPSRPALPPATPGLNGRQGAPPGVPGQRGGAPARPGTPGIPPSSAGLGRPPGTRPGAPQAPARGAGAPTAPALPPGTPRAPGTARPGVPGMPPGTAGAGRPGTARPGRPAEPPAIGQNKPTAPGQSRPGSPLAPGAGAPPARGVRPGEPKPTRKTPTRGGLRGGPPGTTTPQTPANPALSGRQKPGTRAGAGAGSAKGAGVRPELEGRGVPNRTGGPPPPLPGARQRRRASADTTFTNDLTEDEKLWKVEESAPAVIDHQEEPARKDPKPMLGST